MIALLAAVALVATPPSQHIRFALYGDDRDGHKVHRQIVARIAAAHPDFVINTGDLVHRGNQPELWKTFDEITGSLRKQTEYFAARGNHDLGDPDFGKRFTSATMSGDKLYYSFNRGQCHFIALAVDEVTPYGPSSQQYRWLINDLKANEGKSEHTFVFFHVPPYSIGTHGSDVDVRKTLCAVFEKYHVEAVLNGHDHLYYHTKRNGIDYIVSGGGGAPLYPCNPQKGAVAGDKYESVNHYLIFDVDGAKVHAKAIRANGNVIEEFDLGRG